MQQPVAVPPHARAPMPPRLSPPPGSPVAHHAQPVSPALPGAAVAVQPPAQPVLAPGTVLSERYVIEQHIGGGGFACIYRARDLTFQQPRAIKEALYFDDATREQFALEAEFLRNAHHPHLVRGYASFEQAGRLYLVMEYVDGQTLEDLAIDYIRRKHRALGEAQVLDWMMPICDAVQALHTQPVPIIHRDVKPANIKLSREKQIPILIDLGLAKLYSPGNPTIAAALAFTPGYAPPEQYNASGQTDQRTDVYALGATLYFLLTGYQPTESPARLMTHSRLALRSLNPLLTARTEMIVQRAMALDPDHRYQSAAALLVELRGARAALDDGLLRGAQGVGMVWNGMGNRTSGGRVPERASHSCAQCGAPNPTDARFCKTCGNEITLELPHDLIGPVGASPEVSVTVDPVAPPAEGLSSAPSAPRGERVSARGPAALPGHRPRNGWHLPGGIPAPAPAIPTPPHAARVVYQEGPGLAARMWATGSHETASLVEMEAAASILALLALVSVSLSLIGAFVPPMLLFGIVGVVAAHWVLGIPWHTQLIASALGPLIERRSGLRRILVPGMPMPQEFRLIACVALVVGYAWLIASIAQFIWSLHLGH